METKNENKSFMNRVMVISLIIALGIGWANGKYEWVYIPFVLYGYLRTIYVMLNNNIDNKQFTKTTLSTWSWIILLQTITFLLATATYILCSLIYASDITDWCHIIINTDKYEFLEPIAHIILELSYPDATFISDVTAFGVITACVGVFIYLVTAVVCLFKRSFKEFFILHLTMPLTAISILFMKEEYFSLFGGLLIIAYITMIICCLFRKKFLKAIIAFLILIMAQPLKDIILELAVKLTNYVIDNCEYFPIYIYIS